MAGAAFPRDAAIAVPDARHPLALKLPKLRASNDVLHWLSRLRTDVDERPSRQVHARLPLQAAAIGTTPLGIANVVDGVWRVSYTVRVTTAATTSSEVRVTITWTEGGVTQTETGTLVNGNLTTSRDRAIYTIRADGGTPISYSTSYASVGATAMKYWLDVVAELVSEG